MEANKKHKSALLDLTKKFVENLVEQLGGMAEQDRAAALVQTLQSLQPAIENISSQNKASNGTDQAGVDSQQLTIKENTDKQQVQTKPKLSDFDRLVSLCNSMKSGERVRKFLLDVKDPNSEFVRVKLLVQELHRDRSTLSANQLQVMRTLMANGHFPIDLNAASLKPIAPKVNRVELVMQTMASNVENKAKTSSKAPKPKSVSSTTNINKKTHVATDTRKKGSRNTNTDDYYYTGNFSEADEARWWGHFDQTIKYRDDHGTYNVPEDEVVTNDDGIPMYLGKWLEEQRGLIDLYREAEPEKYQLLSDLHAQGLWIADDEIAKEKEHFKDVEANDKPLSTNSIPKKKRPISIVSSSSSSSISSAPQNTTSKSKVILKKPTADTKPKPTTTIRSNVLSTSYTTSHSSTAASSVVNEALHASDEKTKYRKLMGCNKTAVDSAYEDENPGDNNMDFESFSDTCADEKPVPIKLTRIKECKINVVDDESKQTSSHSSNSSSSSSNDDVLSKWQYGTALLKSTDPSTPSAVPSIHIKSIADQIASKKLQLPLPEDTLEDGEIREMEDEDQDEDSDYAPSPVSASSKNRTEGNGHRPRHGRPPMAKQHRVQHASNDSTIDHAQVIDAPLSTKSYHKNALARNPESTSSASSSSSLQAVSAPQASKESSKVAESATEKAASSPMLPYERMMLYSYKDKDTNQMQASLGMVVMQRGTGTDRTKWYWTIARLNPANPNDFYSTNFIVNKLDTYDIQDTDVLCGQIYFDSDMKLLEVSKEEIRRVVEGDSEFPIQLN